MKKYVLIQGAMKEEIDIFLSKLQNTTFEEINGYKYYIGNIDNKNVIISLTKEGTINSVISTMIALNKYNIYLVINQGIAGSHRKNIDVGDIVVATKIINNNSFSTKIRNCGSNSLEWEFGENDFEIETDSKLLDIAKNIKFANTNIYFGVIGSGDIFNREKERIEYISNKKNTLCEEMEGYGVYRVCKAYNIDCIGIRAISNNELTKKSLDKSTSKISQEFLLDFIQAV